MRFLEHKRPSSVNSEISRHIHSDTVDGHGVDLNSVNILTTEPKWFEWGVKEAIYIRINQPSLNKDGGRFNLSPVWTNILRARFSKSRGPPPLDFEQLHQ